MDSAVLTVIGILIGVLIFGLKTELGYDFSNFKTREILAVGSSYFFLALLFGSIVDNISMDSFEQISSMGMGFT